MLIVELAFWIFTAALYVLSTGLLYYERHKANPVLFFLVVTVALASTVFLVSDLLRLDLFRDRTSVAEPKTRPQHYEWPRARLSSDSWYGLTTWDGVPIYLHVGSIRASSDDRRAFWLLLSSRELLGQTPPRNFHEEREVDCRARQMRTTMRKNYFVDGRFISQEVASPAEQTFEPVNPGGLSAQILDFICLGPARPISPDELLRAPSWPIAAVRGNQVQRVSLR